MKFNFRFTIIIVILLVMLVAAVIPTQAHYFENDNPSADTLDNPVNYPWKSIYIQREPNPVQDVGAYVSMVLRPFDDAPIVTYYDYTNGDLMLAVPVGAHNGNCGTEYAWLCEPVDGTGTNVGSYTSIDIWGDSVNLYRVGISYRDNTNNAIKVSTWTCVPGYCNHEYFTIETSSAPNIGIMSSLKFDSSGYVSVAYYLGWETHGWLAYAHQVDEGGNCGEGSAAGLWECEYPLSFDQSTARSGAISLDFRYDGVPYLLFISQYFDKRGVLIAHPGES